MLIKQAWKRLARLSEQRDTCAGQCGRIQLNKILQTILPLIPGGACSTMPRPIQRALVLNMRGRCPALRARQHLQVGYFMGNPRGRFRSPNPRLRKKPDPPLAGGVLAGNPLPLGFPDGFLRVLVPTVFGEPLLVQIQCIYIFISNLH